MNKKMKKYSTFIVITFCILFAIVFKSNAQDYSGRISEIKKMYAEIVQLEKAQHPLCKTGIDTTYESFDNESEKYPFIQRAQYCNYSGNYQTASGYFTGYEWTRNIFAYLKNKAVFFIFIEGADAGCLVEYRIYYDINGKVIKVLLKENDCDGDDPYKSSVIQSVSLINSIVERINNDYNSILKLVK